MLLLCVGRCTCCNNIGSCIVALCLFGAKQMICYSKRPRVYFPLDEFVDEILEKKNVCLAVVRFALKETGKLITLHKYSPLFTPGGIVERQIVHPLDKNVYEQVR